MVSIKKLDHLVKNAGISIFEMTRNIGASETTVNQGVRKMGELGIISEAISKLINRIWVKLTMPLLGFFSKKHPPYLSFSEVVKIPKIISIYYATIDWSLLIKLNY